MESYNKDAKNVYDILNCDDYEIEECIWDPFLDKKYYLNPLFFTKTFYERKRIIHTRKGYSREMRRTFQRIGIAEGIELNNNRVKYIIISFNDFDFKINVPESNTNNTNNIKFIKFPFVILTLILQFTQIDLTFYNNNSNKIPYDEIDSWIIDGQINYNMSNIKFIEKEFNYNGELYVVCYSGGMTHFLYDITLPPKYKIK